MKKDVAILSCIIIALIVLITGVKFETVAEHNKINLPEVTPYSKTVTLLIECRTLIGNEDLLKPELRQIIPKNGIILKKQKYVLQKDDTVFDLLQRATKFHAIQMEYQGANDNLYKTVYIQGIHYLYEFSAGERSGWMYEVNGNYPNIGVSKYKLKNGDAIQLRYTIDLGKDIGGDI